MQVDMTSATAEQKPDDFYDVIGEGIKESALLLSLGDDAFLLQTKLGEAYDDLSQASQSMFTHTYRSCLKHCNRTLSQHINH